MSSMTGTGLRDWLRTLAQPTTYLGLGMLAFVLAGLTFLMIQSRVADEDDAKRTGGNVARLFSQSISEALTGADNTLRLLRNIYESHPDETNFILWPTAATAEKGLEFQYSLMGPDGVIKASSYGSDIIGRDVSGTEQFKDLRTATNDHLFVSKPVWLRSTKKWGLILARRLTGPDGSFAGIITASFQLSQVHNLFRRVQLGVSSGITLLDFDGVVYARTLQGMSQSDFVGKRFPKAGILKQVAQASVGGYWNDPETVDGVRRLLSYRVVDGFPLIAVVGVSEAAVFEQWDKAARVYLAIAGVLATAILMAIALGAVREKRLIAAKQELERVNLWFDTALDSMSQGLSLFDSSGRLLLVNNRYREMYGLAPDLMKPGDSLYKVFAQRADGMSPAEIDAYLTEVLRRIHAGEAIDKIVERPDGRFYAVSVRPIGNGGWVTTHQDVTEKTRAEREVLHLAHYDPLTDLTSRALFQTHVGSAVVQLRQHGESFNILLLDLDRFKAVNELVRPSRRRPVVASGGRASHLLHPRGRRRRAARRRRVCHLAAGAS